MNAEQIRRGKRVPSPKQTVKDIGELAAIERVRKLIRKKGNVICGIGDDCAVVRPRRGAPVDWILTSDPVIEGTHFQPDAPPAAVGHKALGRVLSDLAAMGAEPAWALINVAAPDSTPVDFLEGLYRGAAALADDHGLAIVGGDMARGPALEIHVFAVGAVPVGSAVLRSGAVPGDHLFVTGALGGSRAGRHLAFRPRVREGVWLRGRVHAMIDVSDGLASDLHHIIAASGTGARIEGPQIPVSAAARNMHDDRPPLDHALYDGEDFELLFSVAPDKASRLLPAWKRAFRVPCTRIGRITDQVGVVRCERDDGSLVRLTGTGYVHWQTNTEP